MAIFMISVMYVYIFYIIFVISIDKITFIYFMRGLIQGDLYMITIIGAGKVGVSAAVQLAVRELDDITLIDIIPGRPQGEALDLGHMASILGLSIDIRGSNDYKDMEGSDLVIVTAGFPRTADMTREDLLRKNADVIKTVGEAVKEHAPDSVVVLTTNPLDIMTYGFWKVSGMNAKRVIGFSGVLDGGRLAYYISKELGISPASIQPTVIGQHGRAMVVVPRLTYVAGRPLTEIASPEVVKKVKDLTIDAGRKIIELRGWSSHHAPGAGLALMAEAIKKDQKKAFPATVYLNGEYGIKDVFVNVPAILGRNGVEKIIELPLNDEELAELRASAEAIKRGVNELLQLIKL